MYAVPCVYEMVVVKFKITITDEVRMMIVLAHVTATSCQMWKRRLLYHFYYGKNRKLQHNMKTQMV